MLAMSIGILVPFGFVNMMSFLFDPFGALWIFQHDGIVLILLVPFFMCHSHSVDLPIYIYVFL